MAKQSVESAAAGDHTQTIGLTQAGTIMGTPAYLSPEQAEGRPADARSDLFSFGAMLYEMVTGKRAFEGKSQLSVASAILEKEPEAISAVQPLSPPALEHVVLPADFIGLSVNFTQHGLMAR